VQQKIQEMFEYINKEQVVTEQMDYHDFLWIMDFITADRVFVTLLPNSKSRFIIDVYALHALYKKV
jgi:predicted metallopeptidase